VSTLHDAHRTFQGLPDDNATQVTPAQPENPEQMQPDVALAHHLVDLSQKKADVAKTQAEIGKTHAETLLTAAKIPNTAQQTAHVAHQTHNVAVTTNRLMRTPIPQPAPPGGTP
jgi:hypothetical protein